MTAVPLYDYKCSSCGNQYELREGFDAPSRQPCPKCGNEAKRVLHPPPIVFKGSGFYITDSKKGDSATLADNSFMDTNGNGSSSSDSKKSDSKAATTSTSDD
jgi:putative FmdB family regulatory protein